MATVSLAGYQNRGVMLGLSPFPGPLLIASVTWTVIYSSLGGWKVYYWIDFFQFFSSQWLVLCAAAITILRPTFRLEVFNNLWTHEKLLDGKTWLSFPISLTQNAYIPFFDAILFSGGRLGIQSRAAGGGYIARSNGLLPKMKRMHRRLFFQYCHYAIRPWPWF